MNVPKQISKRSGFKKLITNHITNADKATAYDMDVLFREPKPTAVLMLLECNAEPDLC